MLITCGVILLTLLQALLLRPFVRRALPSTPGRRGAASTPTIRPRRSDQGFRHHGHRLGAARGGRQVRHELDSSAAARGGGAEGNPIVQHNNRPRVSPSLSSGGGASAPRAARRAAHRRHRAAPGPGPPRHRGGAASCVQSSELRRVPSAGASEPRQRLVVTQRAGFDRYASLCRCSRRGRQVLSHDDQVARIHSTSSAAAASRTARSSASSTQGQDRDSWPMSRRMVTSVRKAINGSQLPSISSVRRPSPRSSPVIRSRRRYRLRAQNSQAKATMRESNATRPS